MLQGYRTFKNIFVYGDHHNSYTSTTIQLCVDIGNTFNNLFLNCLKMNF